MTNAQMAHKMGLDKFTGYVEDCDSLAKILKTMGFKVEKDDRRVFDAVIIDSCDNTLTVHFGNDVDNLITARIDKINGTHKWYYGKTVKQILAAVRQCMEPYKFPEPKAEEPETKEEEETVTRTEAIEAINTRQNEANLFTNVSEVEIEAETKKEDTTMKSTITLSLTEGIAKFTKLDGTTYTYNVETKRYSKILADGRKTRIGKAEYEAAKHEYDLEQEVENLELHPAEEQTSIEDAQAELDKEPCRVEVNSDLYVPAVLNEVGCVDCSGCNVMGCVHRDCMRRNPRNVGGLGECPRLGNPLLKPEYVDPNDPANAYPDELDNAMEKLGYHRIDSEWNDFRYATDAHEVMAWNTVEEGLKWAEEQVAGDGTPLAEVGKEIAEQAKKKAKKAEKAKKARKSKDIAYEGHGVTLTAKQVDFLRELRKTEAFKEDENDMVIEDITITIGGQFEDKPMTVGAMISTLCEKRLGTRIKAKVGNRTMTLFGLSPIGKDIMNAIK